VLATGWRIPGDLRPVRQLNCGQVELACQGIFPIINQLGQNPTLSPKEGISKVWYAVQQEGGVQQVLIKHTTVTKRCGSSQYDQHSSL
jgi:hypothetical protein